MSSRILVTGGAGFIGSNLANSLAEGGNQVTVLDDLSLGVQSNLKPDVHFVKGSVLEADLVDALADGMDYIFHDAAKSSSPMFKNDPREGIDVNITGFMNVMQAAKNHKVCKVVYASSSSIYNGQTAPFNERQNIIPKTFYETSFYTREVIARSYFLEYGVKSIGLRYFSVYGDNERHKGQFANNISQFLWDMVEDRQPVIYGDGSQTRDFTNVEDVVKANIYAAISPIRHGVYNVGTGKAHTFNQIIHILNQKLGKRIKPKYISNPITNYVQGTLADTSLATRDLNFTASINVEEGIEQLVTKSRL